VAMFPSETGQTARHQASSTGRRRIYGASCRRLDQNEGFSAVARTPQFHLLRRENKPWLLMMQLQAAYKLVSLI
jgi:hypothetical protein